MNITVFRVYQLNLLTAISMYMKSLFYLFLSIVGAWLFSSCSDDFLGETETTDLDQATVFADSTYTADFLNQIYVDIGFDIQHNRYKEDVYKRQGNAREQNTRNLVTLGITQDLSMITKGLSAKVQGSWDTQSLFGEARYKMPELNEALKERNPNGTLSFEKIADEKTVTYSSAAWVWRKLYLEANVNYDRTFGDHRLGRCV